MGILVWNGDETFLRKTPMYAGHLRNDVPSWIYTWRAKHVKRTANPRVYIYYSNMKIIVDSRSQPISINSNGDISLSVKELEEMMQAIKEAYEVMRPIAEIRDILE